MHRTIRIVQSSVELGTVSLTTVNNFEVTGVEATGLIGDEFSILAGVVLPLFASGELSVNYVMPIF
jgi:hypothetical protein